MKKLVGILGVSALLVGGFGATQASAALKPASISVKAPVTYTGVSFASTLAGEQVVSSKIVESVEAGRSYLTVTIVTESGTNTFKLVKPVRDVNFAISDNIYFPKSVNQKDTVVNASSNSEVLQDSTGKLSILGASATVNLVLADGSKTSLSFKSGGVNVPTGSVKQPEQPTVKPVEPKPAPKKITPKISVPKNPVKTVK